MFRQLAITQRRNSNEKSPYSIAALNVETSSAGSSILYVEDSHGTKVSTAFDSFATIALLDDTAIAAPSDGEVLTYSSSTSKWVNAAAASGGVATLGDLTDVTHDYTTLGSSHINLYDGTAWRNNLHVLSLLYDVDFTTLVDKEQLTFNSTAVKWQNTLPFALCVVTGALYAVSYTHLTLPTTD